MDLGIIYESNEELIQPQKMAQFLIASFCNSVLKLLILCFPVLGSINNSISVMVRAASLTATFRPSRDLRSHVPGDTSDPD